MDEVILNVATAELVVIARAYERFAGEIASRVELRPRNGSLEFGQALVFGVSGRELARIENPEDGGYEEAVAAWDALGHGRPAGRVINLLQIGMDGRISFD